MVEVLLFTRSAAPVMVCCAVHAFAFPTFNVATTSPVVGEIVREPFPAETEDTAPLPPVKHVPSIAKHPSVMLIPFASVEEAVAEVRFRIVARTPALNVEVAVVEEAKMYPTVGEEDAFIAPPPAENNKASVF